MTKKRLSIIISILISVLFVRAVFKFVDFGALKSICIPNPEMFIFAVLAYIVTYPARAFRIHYLSRPNGSFFVTQLVSFRHQFFGRIIPFRAGDLSLVYLLGKFQGVEAPKSSGVLLAIRFFDAGVMLVSFLFCSLLTSFSVISPIATVILIFVILFASIFAPSLLNIIAKALGKRFSQNKIVKFLEKMRVSLTKLTKKDVVVTLFSTIILWICIYYSMHFVILAFGVSINIFETVTASFLASAAALLPVNGLGGFGTTETGWTAGFILMGVQAETAVVSGICSNLMSFVIIVIFGLLSLLLRRVKHV